MRKPKHTRPTWTPERRARFAATLARKKYSTKKQRVETVREVHEREERERAKLPVAELRQGLLDAERRAPSEPGVRPKELAWANSPPLYVLIDNKAVRVRLFYLMDAE